MPATPPIRTAVVPAAGIGTRMLPASKSVPKELLPIVDRPALQFVVDEAVGAGVDHLVIVTSSSKPAIRHYFEPSAEVDRILRAQGRADVADRLARIGRDVRVTFVEQDQARGLGHAVGCARAAVGDQPFFVMLPDELMADSSLLVDLAAEVAESGVGAVALKRVPPADVVRYGIVDPVGDVRVNDRVNDQRVRFVEVVEKPSANEAPSDLAIIGRYALTPDIFDDIASLRPAASGEIQLTDALAAQGRRSPLVGVISRVGRRDVGNPLGWLQAVVEAGVRHPDLGDQFRNWLREFGALD